MNTREVHFDSTKMQPVGISHWNTGTLALYAIGAALVAIQIVAGFACHTFDHIAGVGPEAHGWDKQAIDQLIGAGIIGVVTGGFTYGIMHWKREQDRARAEELQWEKCEFNDKVPSAGISHWGNGSIIFCSLSVAFAIIAVLAGQYTKTFDNAISGEWDKKATLDLTSICIIGGEAALLVFALIHWKRSNDRQRAMRNDANAQIDQGIARTDRRETSTKSENWATRFSDSMKAAFISIDYHAARVAQQSKNPPPSSPGSGNPPQDA